MSNTVITREREADAWRRYRLTNLLGPVLALVCAVAVHWIWPDREGLMQLLPVAVGVVIWCICVAIGKPPKNHAEALGERKYW